MALFGSSGIRTIADEKLLLLVQKLGLVTGRLYHRLVIGQDTRTSSDALKYAFVSGVLAAGAECYDAGLTPTPTLAFAAREFDAGAMITASHNPPEYNGIKFVNPDGSAFDSTQRRQIEGMVGGNPAASSWDTMGNYHLLDNAIERHLAHIKNSFTERLEGIKVVVDCCCGAASPATPRLLRDLGCQVIESNCHPSGSFPHGAEPNEENLTDLSRLVKEYEADLGIAHDIDADRAMVVDDRGRFVPGDKLLVLFARQMNARKVVTIVDASMIIEETGLDIVRTRVGDSYVSEELKNGGDFGGEPSGSWIFPAISFCPDGIYTAALLALLASRQKLSGLIDSIPQYPIIRGSVRCQIKVDMSTLAEMLEKTSPEPIDRTDGIKLYYNDGWILVRPSGTEPKVRLTVEAKTEARAQQIYESGMRVIKELVEE